MSHGTSNGSGGKIGKSTRTAKLLKSSGDGDLTVVRVIPRGTKDNYWKRSTIAAAQAEASAVAQAIAPLQLVPERTLVLAPSAWIYDQWETHFPLDGSPEPAKAFELDAAKKHGGKSALDRVAEFALDRLGDRLAKFPAAYVVFGVDFHHKHATRGWWEIQAMLVFAPATSSIVATTTKYLGGGSSGSWLFRDHNAESHVCKLGEFGTTLLLNCHDLASLSGRGRKNTINPEYAELQERLLGAAAGAKPQTLLHIGHTLGGVYNWRNKLTNVMSELGIGQCASTARHDGVAPVSAYEQLVRGFRDVPVLVA